MAALLASGLTVAVHAQNQAEPGAPGDASASWAQCQRLHDDKARLACYDTWARQQAQIPPVSSASPAASSESAAASTTLPLAQADAVSDSEEGCRDRRYSVMSRFWELERGSSCGVFGLRGYRPMEIAVSVADGPPPTPTSPSPDHTATPLDYQASEMRLMLSLRTKLAQNLFTRDDAAHRQDSLWFGYTQQSTWQVFNADLSRPFRTTDHEPELMYVYPVEKDLPGGWRWRYAGLGVAHQSNGQSLPLSRSWNRVYLMGGLELEDRWRLTARAWQRIPESADSDDNPDIANYIGRVELTGWWSPDKKNTLGATWRTFGRGSLRLEWLRALGNPDKSDLRLHVQLFYGYGDTLVDYNQRRTVLSVGLSLVDF